MGLGLGLRRPLLCNNAFKCGVGGVLFPCGSLVHAIARASPPNVAQWWRTRACSFQSVWWRVFVGSHLKPRTNTRAVWRQQRRLISCRARGDSNEGRAVHSRTHNCPCARESNQSLRRAMQKLPEILGQGASLLWTFSVAGIAIAGIKNVAIPALQRSCFGKLQTSQPFFQT